MSSNRAAPAGGDPAGKMKGSGESQGGAYPRPHREGAEEGTDGFMGHGGQSEIGYHGKGRLGDRKTEPGGNPNAGASDD